MVSSILKTCPSTKVVMSGYSQGGQIVHNAVKLLPAATLAKVSSAVIFGDPGTLSSTVVLFLSSNEFRLWHTGCWYPSRKNKDHMPRGR